jgi:DNA polymerase (family X)
MENPHVDIIGHLTGRKINKRDGYMVDVEQILQKAKETETALEINGQPDRAELKDIHVKRAVELGIPLAVNTDAHSIRELDHMVLAVHIARRGWAEPKHILNTKTAKEIKEWLKN